MPVKVFIKFPGCRLKLNFFTDIFQRFGSCNQRDTLKNSYFEEQLF